MKQTAAEHEKADEALKNKITKKNSFESLLNTMKSTVESNEQMPQDKKQDFLDKLKPFEDWFYGLDGNNFEEDELVQKETELRDLIKELSGGAGMPGQ